MNQIHPLLTTSSKYVKFKAMLQRICISFILRFSSNITKLHFFYNRKARTMTSVTDEDNKRLSYVSSYYDDPKKALQPQQRRWWKCTLMQWIIIIILFIGVIFGIIALVMKFGGMSLAKKAIKNTDMEVQRMELIDPKNMSFVFKEIQLNIHSKSMFHATMQPANMSILINGQTIGYFTTNAMDVKKGNNKQILNNALLTIQELDAWIAFSTQLVHGDNVTITLKGYIDMDVHFLWGMHIPQVPVEKELILEGMRGLKTLFITKFELSTMNADTCIYNPSIVVMEPIGASCMLVHYPANILEKNSMAKIVTGVEQTLSVGKNDRSHPTCAKKGAAYEYGYNLLQYNGTLLAENATYASEMLSKYVANQPVDISVTSCSPGATSITLYNPAMLNLIMYPTIPARSST